MVDQVVTEVCPRCDGEGSAHDDYHFEDREDCCMRSKECGEGRCHGPDRYDVRVDDPCTLCNGGGRVAREIAVTYILEGDDG